MFIGNMQQTQVSVYRTIGPLVSDAAAHMVKWLGQMNSRTRISYLNFVKYVQNCALNCAIC